ncbi:hypothetical protein [Klebsiella variicola]|uniref:hypothetical protein n=1 Tax=Klebsiella variicola TaxID=244366 RepID=UPI0034E03AC5
MYNPNNTTGVDTEDALLKKNYLEENAQGLTMINPNQTGETYYNPQDPQSIAAREDFAAKQRKADNGGLDFQPASTGQMLLDMLGSMLITYGASRLLGADGNAALGLGLQASAVAHDMDKQEQERYGIIKSAIKRNGNIYSPEMLWEFMKTGKGDKMEQTERDHYNTDERYKLEQDKFAQQNANREDSQSFQAQQQDQRLANQASMQADRLAHGLGSGANSQLVDQNGQLTWHGMNAGTSLAGKVAQMKAPYIKSLQSRMAKLASAEGMKTKIMSEIQNGNYMQAQTDYKTMIADLASANKGGNAATSPEEQKEIDSVGGIINEMENKARSTFGYTPNPETMNAMFNNLQNIGANDRSAINNEIEKEVSSVGGGVVPPEIVKYAASILQNQEINPEEIAQGTSNNVPEGAKSVSVPTSQLAAANGQSSDQPDGSTISNGVITLKVVNGKWTIQD